jgi:hydrogenase maturation protease
LKRKGDILVIGFGNPGRLDDGLGPALAAELEAMNLEGVDVDSDYQLTVEDAAAAAEHGVVIFADADATGAEPFTFRPVDPRGDQGFSTHEVEPPSVMAMARDLFAGEAKGYTLGIRGYEFDEFGERLTPGAKANLAAAVSFLRTLLRTRKFEEASAAVA